MGQELRFPTARLKVHRAEEHINDLQRQIAAYLATKPIRFVRDPNFGPAGVGLQFNRSIPKGFSLIIGDAVHNLRSALDHAVWEMIGSNAKSPETVQYPFPREGGPTDDQSFHQTIVGRQLQLAGPKVVDAVKRLNARPNGNAILYGVHLLDIRDKHKLVVATANSFDTFLVGAVANGGSLGIIYDTSHLSTEQLIALAKVSDDEAQAQLGHTICFAQGQPFAHQDVTLALHDMVAHVTTALDDLAVAFFPPPPPLDH
jgi:hypothetical protein